MTTTTDLPLLTMRSPQDILEAVPYLLGFEPTDSIVVLSLRGRRRRLGLTARVDVVDSSDARSVADQVVAALRRDGASAAIVVAYGGPGRDELEVLVAAFRDALRARRIDIAEALRVADGRWTSYLCELPACCPPEGTPVADRVEEPGVVGSTAVAAGMQVLPAREVVEARLAPVAGLMQVSMVQALEAELDRYDGLSSSEQRKAHARETLCLVRSALERNDPGAEGVDRPFELSVDDAARILVGMLDVQARDAALDGWEHAGLATLSTEDLLDARLRPRADRLWSELVRRAVLPGLVAPVATLLAWNVYLHHGGGALLTIALERALDDVPGYVMAEGLLSLIMGGVSPAEFAGMVAPDSPPPRPHRSRRARRAR